MVDASGQPPKCPVCGSTDGYLGTSYAYFVCNQCKRERYWTVGHEHPSDSGLAWGDAVKASPWSHLHPSYARSE
jgi:tRNA(Ile2) C34 agmatinyltransferase TiaS